MAVTRCRCRTLIEWVIIPGTGRRPFEHHLVEVDQLGERVGWIVVPAGPRKVVALRLADASHSLKAAARRVMVRHECDQRAAAG